MKKFICAVLFFASFLSFSLKAQTAGNTGLTFLKIGFGARNISMGDIGTVSANDVSALFYNPAYFAESNSTELFFSHNQWIQDVRSEIFGASISVLGIPLAFGINTTTVSDIEIRTMPGQADAKFNASYFAGSISTGFHLTENISFGATAKYLYEGLLADEANGLGFDFGAIYKTPLEGLNLGAVVRNLGSMNELRKQATKLPTDIRFGAAYNYDLININSVLNLGAEFQKYTGSDESHVNLGAEIIYEDMVSLRAGYQQGFENRGFSAGLGIKWYNLGFDYAVTPFSLDFGTSHTISIKFKF
ncbi:MAG: PorV/PorQ family protein [Clostridiales bacterium]